MKLNGWQRLWVVAAVIWMVTVFVCAVEGGPTTGEIWEGEVYAQITPDDGRWLIDYDKVLGLSVSVPPGVDDTFAEFDKITNVYVDGQKLEFWGEVSPDEKQRITEEYDAGVGRILSREREVLAVEAFGVWLIPVVALYLLGWAVGWIRRGFSTRKSDKTA